MRKIAKERNYTAKKPMKISDANVGNIVISKLVFKKTYSKYLIGYLDKAIRPLVLIMSKMSGQVKKFKVNDRKKDKNNELMSLSIGDEKLLEKYKVVWTKIEDLKSIYLNALPVYHDRSIQTKIRTYNGEVFTNLCGFRMLEIDIKCDSFIVTCIDSFLVFENQILPTTISEQLCL